MLRQFYRISKVIPSVTVVRMFLENCLDILQLLMFWLIASSSHQHLWHWLSLTMYNTQVWWFWKARVQLTGEGVHLRDSSMWYLYALWWRHNECDGVSNHQLRDCLLSRLFRRKSKKTSKLRVTGLCVGNSSVTGEFPAQRASNVENVSIWWRHHACWWPSLYPVHVRDRILFRCFWAKYSGENSQYHGCWYQDSSSCHKQWWYNALSVSSI